MSKAISYPSVSIVIPMRNASTTVFHTLISLQKQKYPIREIVIVDNASTDNSVEVVKKFMKKSKIYVKLIERKINKGTGASFNEGVGSAKSSLIVLMHSDCTLPTDNEITKLLAPIEQDTAIVATYSTVLFTESVWEKYDFWEKYFFARVVGYNIAGFTTKFDCVKREIYLRIGGVDTKNYSVGNEDGNLHDKLKTAGKIVKSDAAVTHLQYIGEDYAFKQMLIKKRGYSRAYGRILRVKGILPHSGLVFLIKPAIALLPFLPRFHIIGIILLVLFSFLYTKKMFVTRSTLSDPRILFVPFVNIFILYYETFWTIEAFLFGQNKVE